MSKRAAIRQRLRAATMSSAHVGSLAHARASCSKSTVIKCAFARYSMANSSGVRLYLSRASTFAPAFHSNTAHWAPFAFPGPAMQSCNGVWLQLGSCTLGFAPRVTSNHSTTLTRPHHAAASSGVMNMFLLALITTTSMLSAVTTPSSSRGSRQCSMSATQSMFTIYRCRAAKIARAIIITTPRSSAPNNHG